MRVSKVGGWFDALNPYDQAGSILEFEDQNFATDSSRGKRLEPLYCAAISAKRYVLFNLDVDGASNIRKGAVTLPCSERAVSAPQELSGRGDRSAPRVHRRGAKRAVRLGRGEMALDVEGVVDGGVRGEKFLRRTRTLEPLHLALPPPRAGQQANAEQPASYKA
jgi:hypothetical protein